MLKSLRLGKHASLQRAAMNSPPLASGSRGDGVAAIQELLRDLGHDFPVSFKKGQADGIFGPETKRNVEAFQKKAGLASDGIVGAKTLAKLDELILAHNVLEEHTELEMNLRDLKNASAPIHRRTIAVT